MGKVAVGGGVTFNFDEKENKELEGYLVGTQEGQGTKGNSCIHTIKTKEGKTEGFWGCTVLDDKLAMINPGTYIYVEYKGKKKTKDGSSEFKNFDVFMDDEIKPLSNVPGAGTDTASSVEDEIAAAGNKEKSAPENVQNEHKETLPDDEEDLPF